MSSVMQSVNARTNLAGQNRLEVLTFNLASGQRFGINVFKVREILPCPKLTKMPKMNDIVIGIAEVRGQTMSVIDLNKAIGGKATENLDECFVIISEFNSSIQGFLVSGVERITNLNWEDVLPPPAGAGKNHHLTAVTKIEEQLVGILDVEKIISKVSPCDKAISSELTAEIKTMQSYSSTNKKVIVADDSLVARNQVLRVVRELGFQTIDAKNGKEALELLNEMSKDGDINSQIAMVISDIEMPEMDGYTLTAEIRNNDKLKDLHVVLHTSLSGIFNKAMVERVGANDFISKFDPDRLGRSIRDCLERQLAA